MPTDTDEDPTDYDEDKYYKQVNCKSYPSSSNTVQSKRKPLR